MGVINAAGLGGSPVSGAPCAGFEARTEEKRQVMLWGASMS